MGNAQNLTLNEAREDLRARLDEKAPTFWDDKDLNRWLNEGQREVARRGEVLQTSKQVNVGVGVGDYAMPNDLIRSHRVEYIRNSNDVYQLEYRDLHSMDSVWGPYRTQQSRPMFYTLWGTTGSMTMTVFPLPNETIVGGDKGLVLPVPGGDES